MDRTDIWYECVWAMIKNLENAPSTAARETGRVWNWAFSRLEEHPDDFNHLQDSDPESQRILVEEFLKICERRAGDSKTSDLEFVRYAINKSLPVKEAPQTRQISQEVADALAAFGMFLGHQGHNTIDSPGKFPYTAALFGLREEVFADILQSKRIPEAQRQILTEVAASLPKGEAYREYFRRCEAAAHIERHFGFSKQLLSATDVYQRGLDFYKLASRLGPALTFTFSNTSGLWNPLERQGTAHFIRQYGVADGSQIKFKDGFRSTNFVDGILNPSLACRRLYFFNQHDTWDGFAKARKAAKDLVAFDKDARRFVEEVCARMEASIGRLHLVSVHNWAKFPPLALVTRVSNDTLMFSNRGSDLSISHAFWCSLTESGRNKADRIRKVCDVVRAVSDMVSGGLLSVLASLGPFLEEVLGKIECMADARDRISGERLRRLLDQEPAQVIAQMKDKFGLELEYETPALLRTKLEEAIRESK